MNKPSPQNSQGESCFGVHAVRALRSAHDVASFKVARRWGPLKLVPGNECNVGRTINRSRSVKGKKKVMRLTVTRSLLAYLEGL